MDRGSSLFFAFSFLDFFLNCFFWAVSSGIRGCGLLSHLLPLGFCAVISVLRASRGGRKHVLGGSVERVALVTD